MVEQLKQTFPGQAAEAWKKALARHEPIPNLADIKAIAIKARDTIRQAYLDFHGAPLSERQRERKAGTPYADDQLIGAEGPKLIGHIHAYVDGQQLGE